jgi:hypothetical protein
VRSQYAGDKWLFVPPFKDSTQVLNAKTEAEMHKINQNMALCMALIKVHHIMFKN